MATESMHTVRMWFKGAYPEDEDGNKIGAGYWFAFDDENRDQEHEDSGCVEDRDMTQFVVHYEALIHGLRTLKQEYSEEEKLKLEILSEEQSLVNQINEDCDVNKDHLFEYRDEAWQLLNKFEDWSLEYKKSRECDKLENATDRAKQAVIAEYQSEVDHDE